MRPAATSCSSGFHTWVSPRSTSVIAALPRRPSLSPSAAASGKPPAPPPTITIRCAFAAADLSSVTAHRPFTARIGAAVPAWRQAAVGEPDRRPKDRVHGVGGERIGGGDHLVPGAGALLGRAAGRSFGRVRLGDRAERERQAQKTVQAGRCRASIAGRSPADSTLPGRDPRGTCTRVRRVRVE